MENKNLTMSLFNEVTENNKESPFYKVSSNKNVKQDFFSVNMKSAFSKNAAVSECILILRSCANQCSKKLYDKNERKEFLNNISREINLKSGKLDAEIASRDALINKFLK